MPEQWPTHGGLPISENGTKPRPIVAHSCGRRDTSSKFDSGTKSFYPTGKLVVHSRQNRCLAQILVWNSGLRWWVGIWNDCWMWFKPSVVMYQWVFNTTIEGSSLLLMVWKWHVNRMYIYLSISKFLNFRCTDQRKERGKTVKTILVVNT